MQAGCRTDKSRLCSRRCTMSEFTVLLEKVRRGEARASQDLAAMVYAELKRLAISHLARESVANTLQPTALVHEAWMRLGDLQTADWQSRRHFFGAAAQT